MTYEEAEDRLGGLFRCRMPGRYTFLCKLPTGAIVLSYAGTPVVTWRRCGAVELRAGGWNTETTKERINTYAPGVRLRQRRYVWDVMLVDDTGHMTDVATFTEGMSYRDGRFLGPPVQFVL